MRVVGFGLGWGAWVWSNVLLLSNKRVHITIPIKTQSFIQQPTQQPLTHFPHTSTTQPTKHTHQTGGQARGSLLQVPVPDTQEPQQDRAHHPQLREVRLLVLAVAVCLFLGRRLISARVGGGAQRGASRAQPIRQPPTCPLLFTFYYKYIKILHDPLTFLTTHSPPPKHTHAHTYTHTQVPAERGGPPHPPLPPQVLRLRHGGGCQGAYVRGGR